MVGEASPWVLFCRCGKFTRPLPYADSEGTRTCYRAARYHEKKYHGGHKRVELIGADEVPPVVACPECGHDFEGFPRPGEIVNHDYELAKDLCPMEDKPYEEVFATKKEVA